jgi:hypothetical protein
VAQQELANTKQQLEELPRHQLDAEIEQLPDSAIDLSEQVAEIINFLRELLPPDTKWPPRVMPKLRKFLESKED